MKLMNLWIKLGVRQSISVLVIMMNGLIISYKNILIWISMFLKELVWKTPWPQL